MAWLLALSVAAPACTGNDPPATDPGEATEGEGDGSGGSDETTSGDALGARPNWHEDIAPLVAEHCDRLARIPMTDAVESLNLSNAAAIAFYERIHGRCTGRQTEDAPGGGRVEALRYAWSTPARLLHAVGVRASHERAEPRAR